MSNVQKLLERQTKWQKARKALPWPEKVRMAEMIRESARQLRATGGKANRKKHQKKQ